MAESDFLKCSCRKCGGHIEFPAAGAGSTIHCPHCGVSTTLTSASGAPVSPEIKKSKGGRLALSVAVLLVLILGAAGAALFWPRNNPEPEIPPVKTVTPVANPTAPVTPADTINDFKIGKISLQKTPGTGLIYAVGTVKNTLDHQRFGVKIELNLLDEQDQNIGMVSDYTSVIEAHKQWQFKALLTEPKAVKATLADIKEQP